MRFIRVENSDNESCQVMSENNPLLCNRGINSRYIIMQCHKGSKRQTVYPNVDVEIDESLVIIKLQL